MKATQVQIVFQGRVKGTFLETSTKSMRRQSTRERAGGLAGELRVASGHSSYLGASLSFSEAVPPLDGLEKE